MTFNIRHAESGLVPIVEVFRQERPDIICLQEAERGGIAGDLPERIAEALGDFYVVSARSLKLPTTQSCDVAILSRFELSEAAAHSLEPGGWVYAVSARVRAGGRPLHLYSVHTHSTFKIEPRHLMESSATRLRQVSAILDLLRSQEGDVVVAGDFNAPPGLPEYAILRRVLSDLESSGRESHPTFPARAPIIRIDYLLGRGEFQAEEYRVIDARCSDHRPVAAVLARER